MELSPGNARLESGRDYSGTVIKQREERRLKNDDEKATADIEVGTALQEQVLCLGFKLKLIQRWPKSSP